MDPFALPSEGASTSVQTDPFALPGDKKQAAVADPFGLPGEKAASAGAPGPEGLEAQAKAAGAEPILSSGNSVSRTVLNTLMRPLYATSGAIQEAATGAYAYDPARIFKRAGAELLNTEVGGVKPQHKEFGQILEESGVPEMGALSDIMPFLYTPGFSRVAFESMGEENRPLQKGGPLDPTVRGVVGQGLDIFADPLTYLSFGGSAARKVVTSAGTRYLSPKGIEALRGISDSLAPATKTAMAEPKLVVRETARRQVRDKMYKQLEEKIAKDPKLLDPKGVKLFGQSIVSEASLKPLSDFAQKVVTSVPGGGLAARGAAGVANQFRRMFDPFASLADLPPDVRDGMTQLAREYHSASAVHKAQNGAEWSQVNAEMVDLAKKYGRGDDGIDALGKKFASWRERTADVHLTPEEQQAFQKVADIYDRNEALAVSQGIIAPEQAAQNAGTYMHHGYRNPEVLSEVTRRFGLPGAYPTGAERIAQERAFQTFDEAVNKSAAMRAEDLKARAAGLDVKAYGALEPEWNYSKMLYEYQQQLTDAIWRRKFAGEALNRFGLEVAPYDASRVYALDQVGEVPAADRALIDEFVGDHADLTHLVDGFKGDTQAKWNAFNAKAKDVASKLSPEGQQEFARSLTQMSRSSSQVVNVGDALGHDLMPSLNAVKPGDATPYFDKYKLPGELVSVQGGLWGDKEHLIPKAVADLVNEVPRDMVRSAAAKVGLSETLNAYDKYTNLFKAIAYPFWPAAAFRDAYNHLQHIYLGLGVGAYARPGMAARILAGGEDDIVRLAGQSYKASELKQLSHQLGVTDPGGMSFVQFRGEQFGGKGGPVATGFLGKARSYRAKLDNFARTQLWINGMAGGLPADAAAQMTKDFEFDYNELSNFSRSVIRRAIPFSVFPTKSIELYAKTLMTRPGRVANLAKPFMGRADENEAMTSWEGNGYKLRLGKDGRTLTMINGVDLPIRTADMLWAGSPQKTLLQWLGASSPAIKVAYETASGQNPFTGRPLDRQSAPAIGRLVETMPKSVQAWAGLQKTYSAAGQPQYTVRGDRVQPLIEAGLIGRIFSTADRQYREQIRDPNVAARWFNVLTGLSYQNLNMDEQQQKLIKERTAAAKDAMSKQGLLRQGTYTYRPKGVAAP